MTPGQFQVEILSWIAVIGPVIIAIAGLVALAISQWQKIVGLIKTQETLTAKVAAHETAINGALDARVTAIAQNEARKAIDAYGTPRNLPQTNVNIPGATGGLSIQVAPTTSQEGTQ